VAGRDKFACDAWKQRNYCYKRSHLVALRTIKNFGKRSAVDLVRVDADNAIVCCDFNESVDGQLMRKSHDSGKAVMQDSIPLLSRFPTKPSIFLQPGGEVVFERLLSD
jgi:hypothetical protein